MSDVLKIKSEMLFAEFARRDLIDSEERRLAAWRGSSVRPVDPPAQPIIQITAI